MRAAAILLFLGGIAFRLWLVLNCTGSNDIFIVLGHAQAVLQEGVVQSYDRGSIANHPPLMLAFLGKLLLMSSWLGADFGAFFRFIIACTDLASAVVLGGVFTLLSKTSGRQGTSGVLVAALYFCNPASILLSAYHGNFDALYSMLALTSFYLVLRERWILSGVLLGTALNVKLVAIIVLPAMCMHAYRNKNLHLFLCGILPASIPFIALYLAAGTVPLQQIFGYKPPLDYWGVQGIFLLLFVGSSIEPELSMPFAIGFYRAIGGMLVIALCVFLTLHTKVRVKDKQPLADIFALCALTFLILAPGFGMQYFNFPLLALFATSWRLGLGMSWLCGALLAFCYYSALVPGYLCYSHFPLIRDAGIGLGLICWAALIVCAVQLYMRNYGSRRVMRRTSS